LLRLATIDDIPAIDRHIKSSAYGLGKNDYAPEQIQGALQGTFGVDTQLIRDQTYWLIESPEGLAATGGWSFRTTLFGGDKHAERVDVSPEQLDPATDAARIRAFFVAPNAARQGLGRRLLQHCEDQARTHGFRKLTLFATLPGLRLYKACGFKADAPVEYEVVTGTFMTFVPMHKTLEVPGNP
jgi:GNAT superfamily N-acetyltransferase